MSSLTAPSVLASGGRVPAAGHALLGDSGSVTGEGIVGWLRDLKFTGTAALTDGSGTMLLLLAKGHAEASYRLGEFGNLTRAGLQYHLFAHEATDLPRLPARSAGSASRLLRALPTFVPPEVARAGAVDLGRLLDSLSEAEFGGTVTYESGDGSAVALLLAGTVRAAAHDVAGGRASSHTEALRALRRAEHPNAHGRLMVEAISPDVLGPAAAFVTDHTAPDGDGFSGLEVTEVGYKYWKSGRPFLLVEGDTSGPRRRYALPQADAVQPAATIPLPTEPLGWEDEKYLLTLRGRDALDSMMALGMEFAKREGAEGRRILKALGSGSSLSENATRLAFDLSDLKPWLERFVAEGLIRKV